MKQSKEQREAAQNALKIAVASEISRRSGEEYFLEYHFARPDRAWRSDVAWPRVRVALEIQGGNWNGGRHCRPSAMQAEYDKANGYDCRSWLCFYADWAQMKRPELVDMIAETILKRKGSFNPIGGVQGALFSV